MSHLIASDAPLLSPTHFSPTNDSFSYHHYIPPSPPHSVRSSDPDSPLPSSRVLKMRVSPASSDSEQQLCLPTHQLFDLAEVHQPPSPAPSESQEHRLSISIKPPSVPSAAALKRSASPPLLPTKKRAVGERISTKDFIPPDVSGLSKREARLVKNRAAAFLSRQRKREEFETMEIRVAELEQENARLLALAQNSPPKLQPEAELASEVEQLRTQLAAARERERELNAELAKSAMRDTPVKLESIEPSFPSSPSPRTQSPNKSAASLGLMVLLCALPTLLSMPTQSSLPTSFSLPNAFPASSSSFDFNPILPNDFDWSRNSIMDFETDDKGRIAGLGSTSTQKLEFTNLDGSKSLGSLGGLDISFDTISQEDGKIRVRIHPSSSVSSRAASPGVVAYSGSSSSNADAYSALGLDFRSLSDASQPAPQTPFSESSYGGASSSFAAYSPSNANGDPFLGVGGPSHNDFGGFSPFSSGSSSLYGGDMDLGDLNLNSDYSPSMSSSDGLNSRRRVRIALKSMPATGGEGGEWEVQWC